MLIWRRNQRKVRYRTFQLRAVLVLAVGGAAVVAAVGTGVGLAVLRPSLSASRRARNAASVALSVGSGVGSDAFVGIGVGVTVVHGSTLQSVDSVSAPHASVERFDIEPFPDFSAKWANFTGLVLFCIDAKFCK